MLRDYVSDLLVEECDHDESVVRQFIRSVISGPRIMTLSVNGTEVVVEVADSKDKRSLGLMFRDELKDGTGMLFVFENQELNFCEKYLRGLCEEHA